MTNNLNNTNTCVDISNDAGFEKLSSFVSELSPLELKYNITSILEKQACDDVERFADMKNRMYSIDTPFEAKLSKLYVEKCASNIDSYALERLNNACILYGLGPVEVVEKVASELELTDIFNVPPTEKLASLNKYAGRTDYGTEFDTCLAARTFHNPDMREQYEKLASVKDQIDPSTMVDLLHEVDAATGMDFPWIQSHVGTPEYAVFEKIASDVMVDMGTKMVPFEKIAEIEDEINDMGITMSFDENDAYTNKIALERLPKQVRANIASIIG